LSEAEGEPTAAEATANSSGNSKLHSDSQRRTSSNKVHGENTLTRF